jgi:2-octaprenylphenol hydroxylase
MPRTDCDVVVVGAGMVGASLARLLAQAGFGVALVERGGLIERRDPGERDLRVSAVNRASENILAAAGAWDTVVQHGISAFTRMYVWDANSSGSIQFDSADLGVARLGAIVENGLVAFALHRELLESDNVRVMTGSAVDDFDSGADRVTLRLSTGETLRARVLVGADGAASRVRDMLGIESDSRDFGQLGIVANVATELGHQQTAWQRFLSTGPLAFLPLADGACSIVWSCERARAEELMALSDARFSGELTRAFDARLGNVVAAGPRKTFSLRSSHARRYIGARTALVGDAAHVIHPLAGQGVNLGFQDAAVLAEVLAEARSSGKDIGGELTLRRYERWRRGENLAMYHSMNALEALFGTKSVLVSGVRGIGMRLTDAIGPLKSAFAYRAMGLAGDLPEVAEGGSRGV